MCVLFFFAVVCKQHESIEKLGNIIKSEINTRKNGIQAKRAESTRESNYMIKNYTASSHFRYWCDCRTLQSSTHTQQIREKNYRFIACAFYRVLEHWYGPEFKILILKVFTWDKNTHKDLQLLQKYFQKFRQRFQLHSLDASRVRSCVDRNPIIRTLISSQRSCSSFVKKEH